ncbi:hypothetical protein BD310DRAFT_318427 [Dichomitus squalens]|uniref:Uncharacterized protein n=1 Tax=Dichomitus squalens TaxID=114155 RepID=A0A4Q9PAI8_9APHY|nr:hypothetical protein BD310DRAFT_318427 [Dichomitus squalens]
MPSLTHAVPVTNADFRPALAAKGSPSIVNWDPLTLQRVYSYRPACISVSSSTSTSASPFADPTSGTHINIDAGSDTAPRTRRSQTHIAQGSAAPGRLGYPESS